MAKIHITTDEGELIESLTDEGGDIGDLAFAMVRANLIHQLQDALSRARSRDGRETTNGVSR